MQNRRGAGNSRAKIENSHKSNRRNYQAIESSDSSNEYEEETHISYHFRRWANHICSVSNNVTSKLRDLLGSHPSSNTTSNHSIAESCQDDSNANSWTTSSGIIESSNRINNGDCDTRQNHEQTRNYYRSTSGENYCRYDQKLYSRMTEGHRMRHVTANRVETRPDFICRGHSVATYRPVLILPRLHQGVNRQPMDTGSFQSRKHMLKCQNMHGDECADEWYQHYHHLGERWGYEGARSRDNYSTLSGRRQIPEKLSSLMNDRKIEDLRRRTPRTSRGRRRIEPCDYDFESVKQYCAHVSDFHSEIYRNGHGSPSPVHDNRRTRKQNSNQSSKFTTDNKAKIIVWNLQLSDTTPQEPSSKDTSKADLSARPSIMLDIEEKKIFEDRNQKSAFANHEDMEVPVKDYVKQKEIVSPVRDIDVVEHSQNSCDIQTKKISSETQNDDLLKGKDIKRPSVIKHSVGSLLHGLQERMKMLANVHSLDTGPTNRREEPGLAKECIVASCLAGTHLPQCLERQDEMDPNFVEKNEEVRLSFSDRIQDIWRDGRPKVLRSSPGHETLPSRYNLKSEKDVQSELSLSGLNQQPVLPEHLGEYNHAVTLARILEKLIDSKSRTDSTSSTISDALKPPPRLGRRQSKTCLQVNVGVQKSTPMSTTSCQDQVSDSTTHRLIKKQKSRRSFRRNFKPRVSELSIETLRPLRVLSGQSVIPISSFQFQPVVEPLSNLYRFSSTRGSPSSSRDPSFFANDERFVVRDIESLNEDDINRRVVDDQERILSLVLEKIEEKRESTQNMSQQHQPQHFTTLLLRESKIAKARADATSGKGMSSKGHSWWKTKFHIDKSSTLKGKMASFLKCIYKKHTDDEKNYRYQNCASGEARNENIVPIPPVRVRRKCHAGGTKSSKSVQWELGEDVPRSIDKIDSSQVTENRQSNKSTSVDPGIRKATVTSSTNTDVKISYNTSPTLFLDRNKRALVIPEIIQVSKEACTELSNELPVSDRTSIESDIVGDADERSEPGFDDFLRLYKENFESSIDPCQREERDSGELNKFEVSRSFSSKIPLATNCKPVNLFNGSLTVSGRRPSTAPILENSSNHSLRSDAFLGGSEVGRSSKGRECVSQEGTKRNFFKHNRSSLLRVNNSISKKSTMGQSYFSRRFITDDYMEKKSISKASTSPGSFDDEKDPPKISSTDETPFEKPDSEKQLDDEKCDTRINSSSLGVSDSSGDHSTSSTSEHMANQTVAEKILSCDLGEVSLLKTTDLTHDEEIISRPISPPRAEPIDPEQSLNNQAEGPLRGGKSINRNSEHSKDEQRSPKASTYPLDVKPCSSHANKEKEAVIVNWETRKLGDNDGMIDPSTYLKEESESGEILTTLCEKGEKLPMQVEVSEDPNLKSVDFEKFEEIESNKTCSSNLNASKQESDTKSVSNEKSVDKEQPENLFACRIRVDATKTTPNQGAKLQPALAFSTARKTEKYLFKRPDMPVQKLASRNKEIRLERSRRPCLQSKSVPSSRLSPQLGIGKRSVKSARLLGKDIIPASTTVTRFDSANNRSIGNISGVSSVLDDSQNPSVKSRKSQDPGSVAAHKTPKSLSRMTKSKKNSKHKLTRMSKTRNKNTEEMFELIRKVIDVAINESVNVYRETDLRMVSSGQSIPCSIPLSSEKSSELSIDSLEPIRVQTTSGPSPPIRRKIRSPTMNGVDEGYYPFCSLNLKEEIGSSCSQKQSDIWLERTQLHLHPMKKPKIISGLMNDERRDDRQGIKSSKKFLVTSKPSLKIRTSEISVLSNIKSAKDQRDESKFVVGRSQTSCRRTNEASYYDNQFEATVVPSEMVADKNRKESMPFEMEDDLMQSIMTSDLAQIADKPGKLRTSIFDVHLDSRVESAESRLQGSMREKEYENWKLLDMESNSRVMNDENNAKSNRDDRNVEINNKVLEEKVKSSIENGVPLKTIAIADPSIIKHNCMTGNSPMVDRIMRDQDSKTMGSEVQDKPPTKVYNNSEDLFLDAKSEGRCSHTTWASHKNRDVIVEGKIVPETSSKSENVGLYIPENLVQVVDTETSAVGQSNLVLSMTRLEMNKNKPRRRGTLIPRYKRTTLNSSMRSDSHRGR